jgi:DNA repair protein RecO (recombination protein O)
MKRVSLQSAFVLHRRSYRETSYLIELFTYDYGRLTVIAKGMRTRYSSANGLLQPFIPLLVSWSGKGELKTLSQFEINGQITSLRGSCLFAGLYLNELLVCLLPKWDAYPRLYQAYQNTMIALYKNVLKLKVLRSFEKCLLEELGYGLLPKNDVSLHKTIAPDQYYCFMPDEGLVLCDPCKQDASTLFLGKDLLAIAREDWEDEACLRHAKRLTRLILLPLLEGKFIHSRHLFKKFNEDGHHEKTSDIIRSEY